MIAATLQMRSGVSGRPLQEDYCLSLSGPAGTGPGLPAAQWRGGELELSSSELGSNPTAISEQGSLRQALHLLPFFPVCEMTRLLLSPSGLRGMCLSWAGWLPCQGFLCSLGHYTFLSVSFRCKRAASVCPQWTWDIDKGSARSWSPGAVTQLRARPVPGHRTRCLKTGHCHILLSGSQSSTGHK